MLAGHLFVKCCIGFFSGDQIWITPIYWIAKYDM